MGTDSPAKANEPREKKRDKKPQEEAGCGSAWARGTLGSTDCAGAISTWLSTDSHRLPPLPLQGSDGPHQYATRIYLVSQLRKDSSIHSTSATLVGACPPWTTCDCEGSFPREGSDQTQRNTFLIPFKRFNNHSEWLTNNLGIDTRTRSPGKERAAGAPLVLTTQML